MPGLLIAAASLVKEHRLQGLRASVVAAHGLSSCGTQAELLCSMWNLPRPGIEPVSPPLAGRLLSTEPPEKSHRLFLKVNLLSMIAIINHIIFNVF